MIDSKHLGICFSSFGHGTMTETNGMFPVETGPNAEIGCSEPPPCSIMSSRFFIGEGQTDGYSGAENSIKSWAVEAPLMWARVQETNAASLAQTVSHSFVSNRTASRRFVCFLAQIVFEDLPFLREALDGRQGVQVHLAQHENHSTRPTSLP